MRHMTTYLAAMKLIMKFLVHVYKGRHIAERLTSSFICVGGRITPTGSSVHIDWFEMSHSDSSTYPSICPWSVSSCPQLDAFAEWSVALVQQLTLLSKLGKFKFLCAPTKYTYIINKKMQCMSPFYICLFSLNIIFL